MRIFFPVFIFIFFLVSSCGNNQQIPPEEVIASTTSKLWEIESEYAETNEEVLIGSGDDETIRFFSNGIFSIETSEELLNGTWSYDDSNKTLVLDFEGEAYSVTCKVESMDPDEITLVAGDGSKVVLYSQ
ncbi:DUF4923 family protein [Fulvivirga sedimenti]|uniref:DUF4923 family protein n=1 Tax=Fulvivirga sedimenti TaxID=2879465 RepID=A0A9X1KVZ4_9BACT|nr:DUF4923 family protein [Fulvivirga sedimenti]MCA6073444.1 DUF4923 family protein [Fulvivirga sedimenti]